MLGTRGPLTVGGPLDFAYPAYPIVTPLRTASERARDNEANMMDGRTDGRTTDYRLTTLPALAAAGGAVSGRPGQVCSVLLVNRTQVFTLARRTQVFTGKMQTARRTQVFTRFTRCHHQTTNASAGQTGLKVLLPFYRRLDES